MKQISQYQHSTMNSYNYIHANDKLISEKKYNAKEYKNKIDHVQNPQKIIYCNKVDLLKRNKSLQFQFKRSFPIQLNNTCGKNLPIQIKQIISKSIQSMENLENKNKIQNKVIRIISKQRVDEEQNHFEWRQKTNFPVVKIKLIKSKQLQFRKLINLKDIKSCKQNLKLQLQIEQKQQILYTLPQFNDINLLNCIYILNQSLVCFQRLYNRFGYFQPTQKMVFINKQFKCKLWMNQDVFLNQSNTNSSQILIISKYKDQYFYQAIVRLFCECFRQKIINSIKKGKNNNLIDKFLQSFSKTNNFVQGLKFINQFVSLHHLKVIKKLILNKNIQTQPKINIIYQQPFKNKDIFHSQQYDLVTLTNKPNYEIKGFGDYYIKGSNIKTVKFSMDAFHENKTSKCRTINKNSQFFNQNQIQNSIYSKQTIFNKASWFNIQDQTLPFGYNVLQTQQDYKKQLKSKKQNYQHDFSKIDKDFLFTLQQTEKEDEEQSQNRIRNQIQSRIRKQNGWLLNPLNLLQNRQITKSFQEGDIPFSVQIRDRALTKLNKIKTSIAHSIMDETIL